MTTVVYDGRILAADSRVSMTNHRADSYIKIKQLARPHTHEGSVIKWVAFVGDARSAERLINLLDREDTPTDVQSFLKKKAGIQLNPHPFWCIMITEEGDLVTITPQGNGWPTVRLTKKQVKEKPYVKGSGSNIANAAIMMGLTDARDIVSLVTASRKDNKTGGVTYYVNTESKSPHVKAHRGKISKKRKDAVYRTIDALLDII